MKNKFVVIFSVIILIIIVLIVLQIFIKNPIKNKKIGNKIDEFWLEGPLKISALEQVKLLNLLSQSKLPFKAENQKQVQDITILESNDRYILHGKTGYAADNIAVPVGWFVGWIETYNNIFSFAINLDINDSKLLPKREELVREYFQIIGAIKE